MNIGPPAPRQPRPSDERLRELGVADFRAAQERRAIRMARELAKQVVR